MLFYPNAKINIGLNVIEKRPDGYHNIETVFYPIGLNDVLEIESSETCMDYSFSSSGIELGGDPEDNLIIKAYHLLRSDYQFPPVDISLVKQIPFGAGLGGGSSDAAFMLKGLNELFELKITPARLQKYASVLGADCPVFIKNKPVFASGTGNIFKPVKISLKGYYLLLVKPEIHVSTPEAYSLVRPKKPQFSLEELIQRPIHEWKDNILNDFEESVFSKHFEIEMIKNTMYDLGAEYVSMSGSGSSVYGIFEYLLPEKVSFEGCFITGGIMG